MSGWSDDGHYKLTFFLNSNFIFNRFVIQAYNILYSGDILWQICLVEVALNNENLIFLIL
ncbi:hypothetical protein JCM15415_20880 [Methanobacterium movens]